MKNLKRVLLSSAILIAVIGCEKTEIKINRDENNDISEPIESKESRIVIGFYFTWDEWGRKSENCRKAGLCDFRIETIEIEFGNSTPILTNAQNGDMYVEILADGDLEYQNSNLDFFIDENLYTNFNNETYKVPAGVYQIDHNLGTMGGYVLPLIKL